MHLNAFISLVEDFHFSLHNLVKKRFAANIRVRAIIVKLLKSLNNKSRLVRVGTQVA